MISKERVEAIEESTTGAELFENVAEAFEAYGFSSIGESNVITPVEITQADYEELPSPDSSSNIYLVTDG